jgi:hypothetical protein
MSRVAVLNDTHSVAYRIMAFMLKTLDFTVYSAGYSFRAVTEVYKAPRQDSDTYSGIMEFPDIPKDALFVDHYPGCASRMRSAGWNGPVLLYWGLPVGPDWIVPNFNPPLGVGVYSQCPRIARCLLELNRCPSTFFWPPYTDPLDRALREGFEPYTMTVVQRATAWVPALLLEQLRDDPMVQLEVYGGGPPVWSVRMSHNELTARLRRAQCLFHPKSFDAPGRALMEAVLQGVPVVLPQVFLRKTEMTDVFKDGVSCVIIKDTNFETARDAIRSLARRDLNLRIGNEAQCRMRKTSDWKANRIIFGRLVQKIYDSAKL